MIKLLAFAASVAVAPQIGWFAATDGRVVAVSGVAGNLVTGASLEQHGRLLASHGSKVLLLDEGEVVLLVDGVETSRSTAGGAAVAGFDSNGEFRIAENGDEWIAVAGGWRVEAQDGSAWIVGPDESRRFVGGEITAAAVWDDGAVLIVRSGRLWFLDPAGAETDLGLSHALALIRIGNDWAQAGSMAIRRRGAKADAFVLPGSVLE
ncbi:MAG: hypothetical protein R2729_27725 [Bryobacteraceae bacterium]